MQGEGVLAKIARELVVAIFAGAYTELVGVYSGRINAESDIGIVWRKSVIEEILSTFP